MFSFKTALTCRWSANHPHLCFNDHSDTSDVIMAVGTEAHLN